jgi:ABC-type nitrate/sulfonate/bicarbonate transport system substrate-binding protein
MRIVLLFVILFSLLTSDDSISLQLKWKHAFQFAGFYMAKEKGFYQESGLDVLLVEKEPDTNIVEDVLSSKATYGVSDSALVWDRIQGKQVVALKAIFQHSPLVLLSLKSSQIDSTAEIKNRRIMISAESHQNASLMAMLKSYKVDESDLNIIPMTFDLNNLIEGKTELFTAYATDQPYTLQSKGIPYNIHDPSAYGFDF